MTGKELNHLVVSQYNSHLPRSCRLLRQIFEICNHQLCTFHSKEDSCPFCLMRSLYTRLNDRGKTGPRSLKPFEAVYQLGQMEKNGFNWRSDELSLDALIQETLKQVSRQSIGIKKYLGEENFG